MKTVNPINPMMLVLSHSGHAHTCASLSSIIV